MLTSLNRFLASWAVHLLLLGLSCPLTAAEPALARLSFWVPPERMAEFAQTYAEQAAPLLKGRGLVTWPERGRTTVDSVFSRLFSFETADEIGKTQGNLQRDTAWQEVLRSLGAAFGTSEPNGSMRYYFGAYTVAVMMFSGVLKTEVEYDHSVEQLFAKLNGTMSSSLDSRTFVCFVLGQLNLATKIMRLANGGCPYPYHYRTATGDVVEVEIDAYPLGVRAEAAYAAVETTLESGDYIVFCSDGIIEAANAQEDFFGFERTAQTIRQGCQEGLSAEELIDRLVGVVQVFADNEPQADDMTVVVLRVAG